MQITARLEESTVQQLLGELLPLTVAIDHDGEGRWIRIDPARRIDFAAGEGLRVEVGGQLHWRVAGVAVTLTILSAQLLLRPMLVDDVNEGGRLLFVPSLEKMDLKNVPDFLDNGITGIVNKQLEGQGELLAWHYGKALNRRFPLAKDLVEIDSFQLTPTATTVTVNADAIVFTLGLGMRFARLVE